MLLSALTHPVLAILGLLGTTASASPVKDRNPYPCTKKPPAFFLAGDSTTAVQSTGGGGWGNGFLSFLRDGAWGVNYGHNGATTASFVKGGDWATVLGRAREAREEFDVYVTIQFGHNDQKPAANISLSQYQSNLEDLARQVRSAGGEPILLTPLTRRVFTAPHNATDSLHNERLATIAAGAVVGARVLDLNLASLSYVNALGSVHAQAYNLNPTDMTHLNDWGSVVFGRMVADLLIGHSPVVTGTTSDAEQEKGANADGRKFKRWITPDEELSWKIWHGVLA
ncbi:SGNH hydrolase-type esterase domain-containing protein [Coniochaeta sp. 2T2.1]|nr:SGNH hydrolase-type esterase domain-containing protein [Coniochaeta sp. 2T2.1]